MKKSLSCMGCVLSVLLILSLSGSAIAQPAEGANKFLGNITTNGSVRSDFLTYWNQITAENSHKWESVEGTRDQMNWSQGDEVADFANENDIPWKLHTIIWGSQYPSWMDGLSESEQLAEIEEWMDALVARYPDVQMIDVVNEAHPDHAPAPFKDALGGDGQTGYDWIIKAFEMAEERWPDAMLIYNDYNIIEYGDQVQWAYDMIDILIENDTPIDAIGCQAHDAYKLNTSTVMSNIDQLASLGLPILISEYDIGEGDDSEQERIMKEQFTKFWEHPDIIGVTYWGYVVGATWRDNTGLMQSDGTERPALTWLKQYVQDNPNPPNNYPELLNGEVSGNILSIDTEGMGTVTRDPNMTGYEDGTDVTLTAEPADERWVFDSWSGGGLSGSDNPATLTMDSDKTVTAIFTQNTEGNLVLNGDFSSDASDWTLNTWNESDASGSVQDGEYVFTINTLGENNYDVQLIQAGVYLEQGTTYKVSFDAYAASARSLDVDLQMPVDPWTGFLPDGEPESFDLTTEKQTYSFTFTMEAETYEDGRLCINVGGSTETVYIDNITVEENSTSTVTRSRSAAVSGMKVSYVNSGLKVDFSAPQKAGTDIKLYDLKGKLMKSATINGDSGGARSHVFDLQDIGSGIYIVKVLSEGKLIGKSKSVISVE